MQVADLSHLSSGWALHKTWVGLLEEELFQQGDRERLLGLPVSPMADRSKVGISATQVRQRLSD
jgi:3'5'-cyclic nucleotide phosphodiesterase